MNIRSSYLKYYKSIFLINSVLRLYDNCEIAISFNGGKDNIVLLDMINRLCHVFNIKLPTCIYFKSKFEFKEVDRYIDTIKLIYKVDLITIDCDNIKEGLKTLKREKPCIKYIYIGIRSTDPYSENLNEIEKTDKGWSKFIRIMPLLEWNYYELWNYILKFKIPYCQLYYDGYTSIGNIKNTVKNIKLFNKVQNRYYPAWFLENAEYERYGRINN